MPYFYHKKDHGELLIDLSGIIDLVVTFSVGRSLLKVGMGEIVLNSEKNSINSDFICQTCHEHIGVEDIVARCGNCGDPYDLKHLSKYEGDSGLYCVSCQKELESRDLQSRTSNKIPAVKIFSKVSLVRR